MKRTLSLVLCAIMLTSCMMLGIYAAEETTEATTEETAPAFDPLHIVFNASLTGKMNVLESVNGMEKGNISKTGEWDGVKLEIKDAGDPHVSINYAGYIKKSGNEKQYIENNPFMVLKILTEEIAFDDFEIYYCIGDVLYYTEDARSASDYAMDMGDGTLYFIFDLTDDAEGEMRNFRIDINGAEEGAVMYMTDMIFFASEEEALDWCGYSEDEDTTEAPTEAETDAPTAPEGSSEIVTAPPATEDDSGCSGMIGAGLATASLIVLGAVCIKKKD